MQKYIGFTHVVLNQVRKAGSDVSSSEETWRKNILACLLRSKLQIETDVSTVRVDLK